MPPLDRDLAYLWDMRQAVGWIASFMRGVSFAGYSGDKKLQSAVERQLEILGEAAGRVSVEFRQTHPEIPWRQMIGLRNILIHEYGEVKADRVWEIATTNIGELIDLLDPLIPPIDEGG